MVDSNRTLTTTRRRRPPKPKLAESKVLERKDITHDLMLMWIEKPEGFSFKAGQYCTIGREGIERAYSIVSAPHEETLELFVELVPLPEGVLTPLLWELGPGRLYTGRSYPHFKALTNARVNGDTFIYYEEGDLRQRVAADCYVAFHISPQTIARHNTYRLWEVGKPPDFALEIGSQSTVATDLIECNHWRGVSRRYDRTPTAEPKGDSRGH